MRNKTLLTGNIIAVFFFCLVSIQSGRAQYSVTSIPYSPYSYSAGTAVPAIDDVWSGSRAIGFPFCFYGQSYDSIEIGSNGNLTFDATLTAGSYDNWNLVPGTPIPTTTYQVNSIMACYRDINPALPGSGLINFAVYGTAPNRVFVASWDSIPDFSCNTMYSTFQAVLYEGSNIIDINIERSTLCSTWNGGYGIIGVQDQAGANAVAAPGRNNGVQWATTNESWRFTPTSGACAIFGAGPDLTICQYGAATTMGARAGTWTADAGNPTATTIANPAVSSTLITGFNAVGVYSFIYTDTAQADTMTVTVLPTVSAGPDQSICRYGTATMAASGSGTWTALSGNPAAATIINPTSPTTTISGFTVNGTYSFVWSNGSCEDTINITVGAGGTDQMSCIGASVVMSATGTGVWFPFTGQPAATHIVSPTDPNTAVTGFSLPGAYGFVWVGASCTDTIYVIVNQRPDAGPDQTVCTGSTVIMAASGTGTWSDMSSNPSISTFFNLTDSATTVYGFSVAGTYNFLWSNNGCADTVSIFVTPPPYAGPTQTVCQYSTVTMAGTGTGTGTWYADSTNPSIVTINAPTSATTTISGFNTAGIYYFTWVNGSCTSWTYVIVNPKSNAGIDQTICQNASTLMTATGTGTWTADASNPATASIAPPSTNNSVVYGFSATGTYIFYWSDSMTCADTVAISVINCADSVWPGDADANHLVDNNDLLPIGLGYGSTGPVRPVTGNVWQADYAADWANTFVFGVNYKHADCNGDGTIDDNDTLAVNQNFGLIHPKTNGSAPWRSGFPALTAHASIDTVFNNNMLTITFYLGDAVLPVQHIYGLAFTYNFDPTVIDPAFTDIDFGSSWFGNSSNKISLKKIDNGTGQIKAAVTGIDHIDRTGSGAIGTASFRISTAALNAAGITHYLNTGYISDVNAVQSSGVKVQVNEGADTTVITTIPQGINETATEHIRLLPNPARDMFVVTAANPIQEMVMYDLTGQKVMQTPGSGSNSMNVNTSAFAAGLYFVHIATASGSGTVKLTILQ